MVIHDRVRILIENLNMNPNSFSRAIGVDPVNIYHIIGKQHSAPGYELTRKILDAFPRVSAEWLMREKGEIFIVEKTEKANENNENNSELISLRRENELLHKMVNLLENKKK